MYSHILKVEKRGEVMKDLETSVSKDKSHGREHSTHQEVDEA